jgi:predicted component of type VI protein secretion system
MLLEPWLSAAAPANALFPPPPASRLRLFELSASGYISSSPISDLPNLPGDTYKHFTCTDIVRLISFRCSIDSDNISLAQVISSLTSPYTPPNHLGQALIPVRTIREEHDKRAWATTTFAGDG